MLGGTPVSVCAVTSQQVFKGTKPPGLRCSACQEYDCQKRVVPNGSTPDSGIDYCCFAEDSVNEDSASLIVKYESGMHMSYSQNFFVRRKAALRGARLMGYKGTIEFDFYTGIVNVYMHHRSQTETYKIETDEPHFGGDPVLAQNYIDVIKGSGKSETTLKDGLISALMCLKAKESSEMNMWREI